MNIPRGPLTIAALAMTVSATSCALSPAREAGGNGYGASRGPSADALVFRGTEMGASRSLLQFLRGRVSSLDLYSTDGGCPEVVLRGRKSLTTDSSAEVYLDGTRAVDTCLLDDLSPADIAFVEIYPNGHTNRPGYRASRNGLILVFTRIR